MNRLLTLESLYTTWLHGDLLEREVGGRVILPSYQTKIWPPLDCIHRRATAVRIQSPCLLEVSRLRKRSASTAARRFTSTAPTVQMLVCTCMRGGGVKPCVSLRCAPTTSAPPPAGTGAVNFEQDPNRIRTDVMNVWRHRQSLVPTRGKLSECALCVWARKGVRVVD